MTWMYNSDRTNSIRNSHFQFSRVSCSLLCEVSFELAIGFAANWDCNDSDGSDAIKIARGEELGHEKE